MFNFAVSRESLLSGFQWFFFIFCNTVVVPPTLLSAFQLPQSSLLTLTQYAFLATALACFAQAFCGHRRAIMEGPGGLWWGTILTITLGEASRGTPINDIATSLAVGIALSGVLTMLIGFSGLGHRLARLFTFQWFFFIFCNTVVVPPTLLSAFQLPQSSLLTLTQYAFLATALACFAQAFCGHRRAIMEGPGGLWWGTILTITLGEASRGTPINDIATSLAVGIALSGVLTVLIGFSGLGHRLARLFTPSVMVLFMLMLGAQLTTIFFKGMLGLPFGIADPNFKIQLPPFALSVAVMCLVLGMIIFLPQRFARYGLLVGTITGWLLWYFCFPSSHSLSGELHWQWFPLGSGGALSPGIILTAVITGLVNISNTYGAIRGTDVFYPQQGAGNTRYRRSFVATGFMTLITVPLAVIPFSPFVSSIGLLTQTGDYTRRSFIYGSVICLLVALVPALTRLFCSIPLPVSSAVMLVSYLPLLFSALVFSQQITFTARNIYRLALPLFVGIFLMALPPVYLQDLPLTLRPLLSNGLLVGILLAVLMDNLIPWERIE
ncbi:uracil/xanthine transporter [Escherichia coli]|nr:uracil/xanthine transporter [Escherichia coli]